MKKLLVIGDHTEDSRKAFKKALGLAKKTGAAIHVAIFVYESEVLMSEISGQHSGSGNDDLKAQLMGKIERRWQELIKPHRDDLEITLQIVWEKYIHPWVLQHIERHPYDLLIKAGHRKRKSAAYAPADWQLFRDSTVPIYVVAIKHFKPRKVILAALDILARSNEKKDLNRQVLECANRLALATDSILHCVYVVKVPTILKDLDLIDEKSYVSKAKSKIAAILPALIEGYDISPEHFHIEDGLPWGVVSNQAKKLRAQCVVVGSIGRKGIAGKLIGNSAERIIRIAKTDLLVVSPEVRVV